VRSGCSWSESSSCSSHRISSSSSYSSECITFSLRCTFWPAAPNNTVEKESLATDAELWKQICRGDSDAFDAFYRENALRLQTFLRHATGNPQAAEDLMQETFTGIWQKPNGFVAEQGSLRAYLYGIARKRAAQWWRTQRPQDLIANEPAVYTAETVSAITDALQRLSHGQRTLLWLREVEGQSSALSDRICLRQEKLCEQSGAGRAKPRGRAHELQRSC